MKQLSDYVTSIPDFPQPGIIFRDITTILSSGEALQMSINGLKDLAKDLDYDIVCGPESRGFIFGVPTAYAAGKPFVPIRKKGKLPRETASIDYALEYGTASIEIHKDAIKPGQKVILVDDLIATGGTTKAAIQLIESLGGEVVGVFFVIELKGLNGRENLKGYNVQSLIAYEGK